MCKSFSVDKGHGSLNVPIEHHPTIRYMVYNGYYKVMFNIPKMGQLPTPGISFFSSLSLSCDTQCAYVCIFFWLQMNNHQVPEEMICILRCAGALQRGFQDFVWYCQTTMRWPRMPWESHGAWKFYRCCTVKGSWLMILRSYTSLHIGCRNP